MSSFSDPVTYRPLRSDELDLVCYHRESMFRDSGRDPQVIARMRDTFRAWLAPRLADGQYQGVIAEIGGAPVGGIGFMSIDWPPHPNHPELCERFYVLNVFVEPQARGRGIATRLMDLALEEGRRRGLPYAILHATPQGRPLYERLGWVQTAELGYVIAPTGV